MFSNHDINYFCLSCNSVFSIKEFNLIKFKSFLFSFGSYKAKCPICKNKNRFIGLTDKWSHIISTLNNKGYNVLDCSIHEEGDKSCYAYIKFGKPIETRLKPKIMSYDYIWNIQDPVVIKKNENLQTLNYFYKEKKDVLKEYNILTEHLLKWSETIPNIN